MEEPDLAAVPPTPPNGDSAVRGALKLSSDWVSPVNAAVTASTVVLDLLAPALGHVAGRVAAVLGALCLLLLLFGASHLEQQRRRLTPMPGRLAFYARSRKLWLTAMISSGGAALAFATCTHGDAPNPSALGSAIPTLGTLQQSLLQLHGKVDALAASERNLQNDTQAIRSAVVPQDDRGRLQHLGYGLDDASKARAIETCDTEAIALYLHLNETMPLALPEFGKRGGSTLEAPIMANNAHFAQTLKLLASQPSFDRHALSTPWLLTFTQAQSASIPQFDGLLAAARHHGAQTVGLIPPMVKANPLAVAIWSRNLEAINALLAAGADADAPAVVATMTVNDHGSIRMRNVTLATARDEARRLNVVLSPRG
ncbi:conserved hypothetical protein [Paraburkholderia unamae]|uniref:hypothetical protein n=1 Tax=Paraburkholderia unamae TaxID=219649 RepID=UPI001CAB0B95|nr:hypothetical protein [Paraburkholderia unamae]CAG9245380.1 conserved hypothetical protein [Paraburkholderia unamae]